MGAAGAVGRRALYELTVVVSGADASARDCGWCLSCGALGAILTHVLYDDRGKSHY